MNSFRLDELNLKLFTLINASGAPLSVVGEVAVFAANYVIYFLPLLLAGLWLWGNPLKRGALVSTFIAAEIALGLNQIVGLIWFHPRPFMVPVGNTLIDHAADSSFPSDHVTFMVAIAIGLWWLAGARFSAALSAQLAILVAWSRIYLGLHFPFDMVGGFLTAVAGILIVFPFRSFLEDTLMNRVLLPIYQRIFVIPIAQGWCKN